MRKKQKEFYWTATPNKTKEYFTSFGDWLNFYICSWILQQATSGNIPDAVALCL